MNNRIGVGKVITKSIIEAKDIILFTSESVAWDSLRHLEAFPVISFSNANVDILLPLYINNSASSYLTELSKL
jgi:hypothetical protein